MPPTKLLPFILAGVLISVALISSLGNSAVQAQNDVFPIGVKYAGFAPENAMPPYVAKFGNPATLGFSLVDLDQFGAKMTNSENPLMKWSSQLAAFGVGADGYYWIWVWPSEADSLTIDWEQSMASALNSAASSMGFQGEVPVKIAIASGTGGYLSSGTRTQAWRPIVGGIEFWAGLTYATVGFAAKHGSNAGYVINGHMNQPNCEPIGLASYQPVPPNSAGQVAVLPPCAPNSSNADDSWVQFSSSTNGYYISTSVYGIFYCWSYPVPNLYVFMSGLASGNQNGWVSYTHVNENMQGNVYQWLNDQIIVQITAAGGDSSAPLIQNAGQYGMWLMGTVSGFSVTYPGLVRFSGATDISATLGITPSTSNC